MVDFDLDDPLADLLSDGSNDSFFEEPKTSAKRASLTKTPEKRSVSDIFGLQEVAEKTDTAVKRNDDWLGVGERAPPAKVAVKKPAKKISFDDDDDVLNNLGLDKVEKIETKSEPRSVASTKKSSLIQSILGTTKLEDNAFDDILKVGHVAKKADFSPTVKKQEAEPAKVGRRPRQQSSALLDPLGLFSNEAVTSSPVRRNTPAKSQGSGDAVLATEVIFPIAREREPKTKSVPNLTDVPDWLGGDAIKTHLSDPNISRPQDEKSEATAVPMVENAVVDAVVAQQKFAASEIGYQNASIALHQQESQLLMALQLKKYEDNLVEMQRKQCDVLVKQEQQFTALLERQFAKQQVMENNMRLQQERINNHIQVLLSQPSGAGASEVHELKKSNVEESGKLYEDLIATLKQRSHEEMFLLEESYKKQINTLEQSMESIENRLKSEIENLLERHKDKIQQLTEEHAAEITNYKARMDEMSNSHADEIKQLRANHDRVLEEVKQDYATTTESIRRTKQVENALFANSGEYSEKLDSNLKLLGMNAVELVQMREKIEKDAGILSTVREESYKAKEEEIKMMKVSLEHARESAESERTQLFSLVRSLETKLAEQRENSREECWAMQQAAAMLAARSAALDRESEFNRASIEHEREQLKALKENLLSQHEKIVLQLTEEKLSLSAEKSRLETTIKLNQNYESRSARAEVDAAVAIAKEAAEMTDRERESLQKSHCEVELLKRNLVDRERKLSARERDADLLMQNSNARIVEAERAVDEARRTHAQYNNKLKSLQVQLGGLANREKKLAEDKISLSKERIALGSRMRSMKRCGLCVVDVVPRPEEEVEADEFSEPVEHDFPEMQTASDPDLFRLQLQISEENLMNMNANHDD